MSGEKMTKEDFEKFFADADKDGSGELTLEELTNMMRSLGYKGDDDQIKSYFKKMDMSMDNKISKDEFLIGMGFVPDDSHKEALMRRLFKDFDHDGNGEIDREELKVTFKSLGKYFPDDQLDRMIQLVDKDESKSINYEEFIEHVFGIVPEKK